MIAAESAILVTLDIVLSPSLVVSAHNFCALEIGATPLNSTFQTANQPSISDRIL
jgi:hypothetical protein